MLAYGFAAGCAGHERQTRSQKNQHKNKLHDERTYTASGFNRHYAGLPISTALAHLASHQPAVSFPQGDRIAACRSMACLRVACQDLRDSRAVIDA
jgi:hypothetical protein